MKDIAPATVEPIRAAMDRWGGAFVKALAKALLEADNGHEFTIALICMHRFADPSNRVILQAAFPNLWTAIDSSYPDRITELMDAFPQFFEKYRGMAEQAGRKVPVPGPDFYG